MAFLLHDTYHYNLSRKISFRCDYPVMLASTVMVKSTVGQMVSELSSCCNSFLGVIRLSNQR